MHTKMVCKFYQSWIKYIGKGKNWVDTVSTEPSVHTARVVGDRKRTPVCLVDLDWLFIPK